MKFRPASDTDHFAAAYTRSDGVFPGVKRTISHKNPPPKL
jgi:hypothetical protein